MFKELVTRFPESKYTDDSRARMAFLVNALAKHEVAVARYYLARGAPLAAVNRAQTVFQRYPQAPATEDALVVSIQAYQQMGMNDLAATSRRVLEKNFPSNNVVAKSPTGAKAWWKLW